MTKSSQKEAYLLEYQNFGAAHQIRDPGDGVQSHCFTDENTEGNKGSQGRLNTIHMQVAGEGREACKGPMALTLRQGILKV